ncbi:putative peptidoglycan glycosyltransferase FtsW [bioreactor metagenome]|uniref:peptidoglycan glycosyltransferase n=1 Tax=bioreactor metagenome TaxID=1076179 RepID=A0A645HGS6_9ZZZZ
MLLEPHLSGTILIVAIGAIMMFVGGTSLRWFALGGGVFAGGLAAALLAFPDLVPYAMDRIEMWKNPYLDMQDKGHQTVQSMLAIGSGGVFGLGLGNSRQKHLYVPEPQNDFIFSIICEELGFIGAMVVILLFVALLIRGSVLALRAKDKFGTMLVVGIIAQVTVQAVLNIAVVTNTIPNTGISLPFFSYGGTSLMMLLGEMGIVLSVSRQGLPPAT